MTERAIIQPIIAPWHTPAAKAWRPVVLALFAAWLLLVGSHHEPWFDEAQAWLLARDSSLWQLLVYRVRYKGSPGLWHTVLWFAIRAGLPYAWLFVVPAVCAVAGAAVVLWRAPFPPALRVLVLTSYFFGYQFSVVARSYSLDLLLVPLAAVFFSTRCVRPLRYCVVIGLIANANTHGFLAASALGAELVWRLAQAHRLHRPRQLAALATAASLGAFALFCVWQPADNAFLQPQTYANPLVIMIAFVGNAFINHVMVADTGTVNKYDIGLSILLSLALQWPIFKLVALGKNSILFAAILGGIIVFSSMIYTSLWHTGMLFLFWLFFIWVDWQNSLSRPPRRQLYAAMAIILGLQTVQTTQSGLWDIAHPYAPGKQAAQAIAQWRSAHPRARIFGYGDLSFDVQPWFSANIFQNYNARDPATSFVRWDRHEPWMAGWKSIATQMDFWHGALAAKPDLIVASPVNHNRNGPLYAALVPEACAAGYQLVQTVPGVMVWRGSQAADQSLYLFERQKHQPCAPLVTADRR